MEIATSSLSSFLETKSYFKIKLHAVASNHFTIISKINGVKGVFILDTGASTTFVDLNLEAKFKIRSEISSIEASGAGPNKLKTLHSKNNTISLGNWTKKNFKVALIDLSYINDALESIEASRIDGIIGADILKTGKAIIDYEKKYLYLKHK